MSTPKNNSANIFLIMIVIIGLAVLAIMILQKGLNYFHINDIFR